jgi:hypothetical protein
MANNQNLSWEKSQVKELDAKSKNYVGPEGITTKQLEAGLWYVEHKQLLRRILYGFLIAVGAVSWAYTIYGFAYYLARGMNEDALLTKQLVETNSIGHDYILQISAKELVITPIEAVRSTDRRYDLYSQVRNDNRDW